MKAAIKEVLQTKGSVDEQKLRKLVAKKMVDEYGEGKEKEFKNRFETDLFSLVSKNKVKDNGGVYSLHQKSTEANTVDTLDLSSARNEKRKLGRANFPP